MSSSELGSECAFFFFFSFLSFFSLSLSLSWSLCLWCFFSFIIGSSFDLLCLSLNEALRFSMSRTDRSGDEGRLPFFFATVTSSSSLSEEEDSRRPTGVPARLPSALGGRGGGSELLPSGIVPGPTLVLFGLGGGGTEKSGLGGM